MKTLFTIMISLTMATAFAAAPASQPDAKAKAAAEAKAKAEAEKKAAAEAKKAYDASVKSAKDRLTKKLEELNSRKFRASTSQLVKAIDDFLANDPDAAKKEVRDWAVVAYFDTCSANGNRFGRRRGAFEEKFAEETNVRIAKPVLADPKATKAEKLQAAGVYCRLLANNERYAEAEAAAKSVAEMAADKDMILNARGWQLLMRVYRWWNKPDEMIAAGREMCKCNRNFIGSLTSALYDLDRYPLAYGLWKEFGDGEGGEIYYYADDQTGKRIYADTRYHAELEKRVFAYLANDKVDAAGRLMMSARFGYLGGTSDDCVKMRAAFKKFDLTQKGFRNLHPTFISQPVNNAYICANYELFTELVEWLSPIEGPFAAPKLRLAYAMALSYLGREKDALAEIAKSRANEKLSKTDAAKFDVLKAVLEKKDAFQIVKALDLPAKEKLEVAALPGQFALNLKRNDECRRYADEYRKLFKEIPHRSVDVTWSAKSVKSAEDWAKVRARLKPTYVDVKMCGDLDNLVTDVATGRGDVKIGDEEGKLKIEVTQLCDVNGLHVFMAAKDKDVDLIENGFKGGFGGEFYFAPGANQPYICFGYGPKCGIEYTFQTSYTSFDHTRLEAAKGDNDADALRGETWYFEGEYVYHFTFPWLAFYQKLPVKSGAAYKFELLCWGNGCSWGGSQGVHEASNWGDLVFNLKPDEIAAIRRKIIFKTFRSWKGGGGYTPDAFDAWADPVIGDPAFYNECLKPLQDELKGYVDRIKPDMSDADVNEIYEKGAVRWIGLKHEIDLLRRNYLTRKAAE